MSTFRRLAELGHSGRTIRVAIVGAGFVGRGLIHQVGITPGMSTALVVNRNTDNGVDALVTAGWDRDDIVTSENPDELIRAIDDGRIAVTTSPWLLSSIPNLDVVVEATGDIQHGALVALTAMDGGHHVVSLNYETDATVGALLAEYADAKRLVYTGSDGDQPGVMMRLIEYVRGIGLYVVAAVNCKGFLDHHATPESIEPWARRQGTSLKMTTAFTDGTKMNVENCCVANAAGLSPTKRGMTGVETTLEEALEDFGGVLRGTGVVDYTLGGNFGSGVFVIGAGADPDLAAPYLKYLKMGDGPWYLFFRPWHLVHFETPLSIAEAALDKTPTISCRGEPSTQVVTIAKRDLSTDEVLDDVGGWDHYGLIDRISQSDGLLPAGLAKGARLKSPITEDQPIELEHVELKETAPIVRLWRAQGTIFSHESPHEEAERVWEDIARDL